jgi:hypothetical protein
VTTGETAAMTGEMTGEMIAGMTGGEGIVTPSCWAEFI